MPQPARNDGWQPRFGTKEAVQGWEELCRVAPNETHTAYAAICDNPTKSWFRQRQLRGRLSTAMYQHRMYAQWQYKVTAGGRILVPDRRGASDAVVHEGVATPPEGDRVERLLADEPDLRPVVVVSQEGDRYVAQHLELDVSSFGDTMGEALEMLIEALELAREDTPPPPGDLPSGRG